MQHIKNILPTIFSEEVRCKDVLLAVFAIIQGARAAIPDTSEALVQVDGWHIDKSLKTALLSLVAPHAILDTAFYAHLIFNAFSDKSVLVRGIDKKLAQLRQDGGGTLEIGIPDDNDEALLAGEHHYAEET